jgi:hypothetical protein
LILCEVVGGVPKEAPEKSMCIPGASGSQCSARHPTAVIDHEGNSWFTWMFGPDLILSSDPILNDQGGVFAVIAR